MWQSILIPTPTLVGVPREYPREYPRGYPGVSNPEFSTRGDVPREYPKSPPLGYPRGYSPSARWVSPQRVEARRADASFHGAYGYQCGRRVRALGVQWFRRSFYFDDHLIQASHFKSWHPEPSWCSRWCLGTARKARRVRRSRARAAHISLRGVYLLYVERVGGYLGARSPVEARRVGKSCLLSAKSWSNGVSNPGLTQSGQTTCQLS